MTFTAALDRLEQHIALVEAALDAGEEPELPVFEPTELTGDVSAADLDRYERTMARLVVCQTRVQLARVDILEEISGLGQRREAAAAYAAHAR